MMVVEGIVPAGRAKKNLHILGLNTRAHKTALDGEVKLDGSLTHVHVQLMPSLLC